MKHIIAPTLAVNGVTIQHIITADDPFGEPWPPDGHCSIVRRTTNGFTLWRRLLPSTTHNAAECVTAFNSAASTKD